LDGTLAHSKSGIDTEMANLLDSLLAVMKVAVISGGAWPQFEQQVLAHLRHRPLFPGSRPEETALRRGPRDVDLDHESIWISSCPMSTKSVEIEYLGLFNSHYRPAAPVAPWARLKIGAGTPPILTGTAGL
jgi:hypothetical protein